MSTRTSSTCSGAEVGCSAEVVSYICPVLQRPMWDIWVDGRPMPALSVFLRRQALEKEWAEKTRKSTAYRLIHVARWLTRSGDFGPDSLLFGGGDETLSFREHLRGLTRSGGIAEATAHKIMGDLLAVAVFWGLRSRSRRGREQRPPAFRFKILTPISPEGEKSLSEEELSAIWRHLEQERRPSSKAALLEQALWARDLVFWAILISTGIRRGEASGLFMSDLVRSKNGHLYLGVRDPRQRPHEPWRMVARTEWGADHKTGSRLAPIWFERRFEFAWRQWVRFRPVLIAKTGTADHQAMLLAGKPYGSPLGVTSARNFANKITKECGPFFGSIPGADAFHLTPHRIRHTLTTTLRAEGVKEELIAAGLGHENVMTTAEYGHYQAAVDGSRGLLARLDAGAAYA